MKTRSPLVLSACWLFIAACEPTGTAEMDGATDQASQAQTEETVRAVMELDRQWSERAGAGDVEWIAQLHAEDARTLPQNTEPIEGREAIAGFWRGLSETEGLSLSWSPEGGNAASSGDMAYTWGSYRMELPDGGEDRGKYLVVWEMRDGQWRVVADMFSSDLPAPGAEG